MAIVENQLSEQFAILLALARLARHAEGERIKASPRGRSRGVGQVFPQPLHRQRIASGEHVIETGPGKFAKGVFGHEGIGMFQIAGEVSQPLGRGLSQVGRAKHITDREFAGRRKAPGDRLAAADSVIGGAKREREPGGRRSGGARQWRQRGRLRILPLSIAARTAHYLHHPPVGALPRGLVALDNGQILRRLAPLGKCLAHGSTKRAGRGRADRQERAYRKSPSSGAKRSAPGKHITSLRCNRDGRSPGFRHRARFPHAP